MTNTSRYATGIFYTIATIGILIFWLMNIKPATINNSLLVNINGTLSSIPKVDKYGKGEKYVYFSLKEYPNATFSIMGTLLEALDKDFLTDARVGAPIVLTVDSTILKELTMKKSFDYYGLSYNGKVLMNPNVYNKNQVASNPYKNFWGAGVTLLTGLMAYLSFRRVKASG